MSEIFNINELSNSSQKYFVEYKPFTWITKRCFNELIKNSIGMYKIECNSMISSVIETSKCHFIYKGEKISSTMTEYYNNIYNMLVNFVTDITLEEFECKISLKIQMKPKIRLLIVNHPYTYGISFHIKHM